MDDKFDRTDLSLIVLVLLIVGVYFGWTFYQKYQDSQSCETHKEIVKMASFMAKEGFFCKDSKETQELLLKIVQEKIKSPCQGMSRPAIYLEACGSLMYLVTYPFPILEHLGCVKERLPQVGNFTLKYCDVIKDALNLKYKDILDQSLF